MCWKSLVLEKQFVSVGVLQHWIPSRRHTAIPDARTRWWQEFQQHIGGILSNDAHSPGESVWKWLQLMWRHCSRWFDSSIKPAFPRCFWLDGLSRRLHCPSRSRRPEGKQPDHSAHTACGKACTKSARKGANLWRWVRARMRCIHSSLEEVRRKRAVSDPPLPRIPRACIDGRPGPSCTIRVAPSKERARVPSPPAMTKVQPQRKTIATTGLRPEQTNRDTWR